MPLKPINGFIVIKKIERKATKGGILLPDIPGNQNNPINGEVVAICEAAKVKVGDRITFRQTTVINMVDERGQNYEIIHQDHIFGVWEKELNDDNIKPNPSEAEQK